MECKKKYVHARTTYNTTPKTIQHRNIVKIIFEVNQIKSDLTCHPQVVISLEKLKAGGGGG